MKNVFAALLILTAGCTRTVLVDSEPQGATVQVNGKARGVTPARVRLDYSAFSTFEVTLMKEGYRPATARLPMELSPAALICGAICWPLLLWVQQPSHTVFVLDAAVPAPANAPPLPGTSPTAAPTPDVTSGATR